MKTVMFINVSLINLNICLFELTIIELNVKQDAKL